VLFIFNHFSSLKTKPSMSNQYHPPACFARIQGLPESFVHFLLTATLLMQQTSDDIQRIC
ncbi:hypothetical protein, partial [Pantoea ananatis]|uniref:hypothetical protein n=1 Tax=Pantoea ananas TaxID=553 RepID=UPI001B30FF0F